MKLANLLSRVLMATLGAAALAGCQSTPPVETGVVRSTIPVDAELLGLASATRQLSVYPIGANDTLAITVMGEPELSINSVRVSQDGTFQYPLVGSVMAAGRTTEAIGNSIRDRLAARYLRDPVVTVNLLEQGSHLVTVEGAVESPGIFRFQPETTLMGAVALAKGPERSAALDQVVLFREVDGQQMAARFDLQQVRTGAMIDPVLFPGDRVMVGTNRRSVLWQDLIRTLPAFGIFATVLR
ncbi:hypothetical protein HME9302_00895 [Alteripontixanthobacter maritimus]|uniref:Uncharacterized protein n=1 Tax=Alteripontixanthobacter maritimus TaxID=2161824 RepID=A0A369Q492_9SPHN|nr:polysaccharide biosynthesis/export family protein [Alteripontixanthobacter maritimus]RDC59703.1 hypothetical protein HME9302_00895 [Alteripontixanthobacter maritimus]